MEAALRGSYVEFVIFAGITEKYPLWFEEEMYECVHMDESRYTFWVPNGERKPDYYDKQLVEDYSVFLRKSTGEIFVTDYDAFTEMYTTFRFDRFTNSGIAAFTDDCIEYVECTGGALTREYPAWFYEYFTEAVNFHEQTILFCDANGDITVDGHYIFLRNKHGEIKGMSYDEFLKYFDDDPIIGGVNIGL